jgi:hypothetical protein
MELNPNSLTSSSEAPPARRNRNVRPAKRLHHHNIDNIFDFPLSFPQSFVDLLHSTAMPLFQNPSSLTILDGMFTDVGRDLNQTMVGRDYVVYNGAKNPSKSD